MHGAANDELPNPRRRAPSPRSGRLRQLITLCTCRGPGRRSGTRRCHARMLHPRCRAITSRRALDAAPRGRCSGAGVGQIAPPLLKDRRSRAWSRCEMERSERRALAARPPAAIFSGALEAVDAPSPGSSAASWENGSELARASVGDGDRLRGQSCARRTRWRPHRRSVSARRSRRPLRRGRRGVWVFIASPDSATRKDRHSARALIGKYDSAVYQNDRGREPAGRPPSTAWPRADHGGLRPELREASHHAGREPTPPRCRGQGAHRRWSGCGEDVGCRSTDGGARAALWGPCSRREASPSAGRVKFRAAITATRSTHGDLPPPSSPQPGRWRPIEFGIPTK